MAKVVFSGNSYQLEDQESILLGLERHGVSIPSSCRSGVCQTCMLLAVKGEVPSSAQVGLKPTLQKQGYFLACLCKPEQDMEIALPGEDAKHHYIVKVLQKTLLSNDVIRLRLSRDPTFQYYPGQFISIYHPDGKLVRSYSLAGVPEDEYLELHVRYLPGGQMTSWIKDSVEPGDELRIDAAVGDCFYIEDDPQKKLLLIGTGTGLAPLLGIVRDALSKGHQGDIYLYHGSQSGDGLYLQEALTNLSSQYANFTYIPCVSGNEESGLYAKGRANEIALHDHPSLKGYKVYLCGHPDMVASTKKKAFLAGASLSDIFSDPFIISK